MLITYDCGRTNVHPVVLQWCNPRSPIVFYWLFSGIAKQTRQITHFIWKVCAVENSNNDSRLNLTEEMASVSGIFAVSNCSTTGSSPCCAAFYWPCVFYSRDFSSHSYCLRFMIRCWVWDKHAAGCLKLFRGGSHFIFATALLLVQ